MELSQFVLLILVVLQQGECRLMATVAWLENTPLVGIWGLNAPEGRNV